MRTKNILGFAKMMLAIHNWSPDYNKVSGLIKIADIKSIYSRYKQPGFERFIHKVIYKGRLNQALWLLTMP